MLSYNLEVGSLPADFVFSYAAGPLFGADEELG